MKRLTGILLGLTASALWGSFYIIGRWLFGEEGDQLNPYLFTLLRFILAVLFFSPMLLKERVRKLVKQALTRDVKMFFLIALVGIVMETLLVFYSLNFTTSARSSLMANCSPIITVLFSFLLLKQKTPGMGLLGMVVGFAGIVTAIASRGGDIYANSAWTFFIGDGMALTSGICWAFFTVYGSKVIEEYGGLISMFVSFILGAVIMVPVTLLLAKPSDFQIFTPKIWGGMIYTGVFTLALANSLWYAALRYLKPGELGSFGYFSAALTFTLSGIVLKEKFSLAFICAIVLVIGGMLLMMFFPPEDTRKTQ